jgi:hypothetical protein
MKISQQKITIDGIDKIILRLLTQDARTPIIAYFKRNRNFWCCCSSTFKKVRKS